MSGPLTDEWLLKVVMWTAYAVGVIASAAAFFSGGVSNGVGPLALLGGFVVGEQIKLNRRLRTIESRDRTISEG